MKCLLSGKLDPQKDQVAEEAHGIFSQIDKKVRISHVQI